MKKQAILLLILFVMFPAGFGQATENQEPLPEPTIKVSAEAVLLDLVIRDKDGRPVHDLKPENIQILENGQPVGIVTFRYTGEGALSVTASGTPTAPGAPPVATPAEPTPPPAEGSMQMLNLVSLVFDNVWMENAPLAKDAAMGFIDENVGGRTWISVFHIGRKLIILQDFTQDRELLSVAVAEALSGSPIKYYDKSNAIFETAQEQSRLEDVANNLADQAAGGGAGAAAAGAASGQAAAEAKMAEMVVNMLAFSDTVERDTSGRSSLYGLLSLAQGQGLLEGRKTMLYFSQGMHITPNIEALFDTVKSEANRHNVSIYTLDVRGLKTHGEMDRAQQDLQRAVDVARRQQQAGSSRNPVTREEVMLADKADDISRMNLQMGLNNLSESTGGIMIANSNDFAPGVAKISEDISYHYEIAYTPNNINYDGTFREIEVKVDRKNMDIQSRDGYFALPPTGGKPMLPFENPMLAALAASSLPSDLGLRSTILRFDPAKTRSTHTLMMELPLGDLKYSEVKVEKEKRYDGAFAFMALVKDSTGEVVEKFSQNYPVRGPLKNLKTIKKSDALFIKTTDLKPGQYTLETVAHDQGGETFAAKRTSFAVPPIKPGVQLSSVVVVERTEPIKENPDAVNMMANPDDPLQFQDVKIVPSMGEPVIKTGDNKLVLYMVVYPDKSISSAPKIGLEFSKDGQVLGATQPALPEEDAFGRIPFVFMLPLSRLEPGNYSVRAVVQQGSTFMEDRTPFVVALP
jgi:VWFA-related protein